jgi:hypothetical protein
MRAESPSGGRKRRHPAVRRIVIAAILLLAIVEPVLMYRSLTRERDQRQQVFAQSLQSGPDSAAATDAGR